MINCKRRLIRLESAGKLLLSTLKALANDCTLCVSEANFETKASLMSTDTLYEAEEALEDCPGYNTKSKFEKQASRDGARI